MMNLQPDGKPAPAAVSVARLLFTRRFTSARFCALKIAEVRAAQAQPQKASDLPPKADIS
jgi:hypothetical protein